MTNLECTSWHQITRFVFWGHVVVGEEGAPRKSRRSKNDVGALPCHSQGELALYVSITPLEEAELLLCSFNFGENPIFCLTVGCLYQLFYPLEIENQQNFSSLSSGFW
jgi:hypothetical protein